MKRILFLVIVITISCKAQQPTVTLPLGAIDYTNGTYFKDINNELLPYVGIWEGVYNNKKYIIKLVKFTQHKTVWYSENYEFEDEVRGDLKIIDLVTNTVVYNNLDVVDYSDLRLFGGSRPHGRDFRFFFRGKTNNCSITMEFTLRKVLNNTNQLQYCQFELPGHVFESEDCTQQIISEIFKILPNGEFILTKQ